MDGSQIAPHASFPARAKSGAGSPCAAIARDGDGWGRSEGSPVALSANFSQQAARFLWPSCGGRQGTLSRRCQAIPIGRGEKATATCSAPAVPGGLRRPLRSRSADPHPLCQQRGVPRRTAPVEPAAPSKRVVPWGSSTPGVDLGRRGLALLAACPCLLPARSPTARSTLGRRKFLVSMGTRGGKFLGLQLGLCQPGEAAGPQGQPSLLSAPGEGWHPAPSPAAHAPRGAHAGEGCAGLPVSAARAVPDTL